MFVAGTNDGTNTYYSWAGSGSSIQNGSPDGVAISYLGTVCEFLSYEGTVTALDGPANTLTSTDIGASQENTTTCDQTLQLIGATWMGATATVGAPNMLPAVCTQSVTTPASDTQYLCDGDAADLVTAEATIAYSGDGSVFTINWFMDAAFTMPYIAADAIAYPATGDGCNEALVTLYAQATCSDDASTSAAGTISANVYPAALPTPTIINNGCTVEVSDECGFAATFSIAVTVDAAGGYTNGDTGTGYQCPNASPTETGIVTYTLTDVDPNRPAACNNYQVTVPFSCGNPCNANAGAFPQN